MQSIPIAILVRALHNRSNQKQLLGHVDFAHGNILANFGVIDSNSSMAIQNDKVHGVGAFGFQLVKMKISAVYHRVSHRNQYNTVTVIRRLCLGKTLADIGSIQGDPLLEPNLDGVIGVCAERLHRPLHRNDAAIQRQLRHCDARHDNGIKENKDRGPRLVHRNLAIKNAPLEKHTWDTLEGQEVNTHRTVDDDTQLDVIQAHAAQHKANTISLLGHHITRLQLVHLGALKADGVGTRETVPRVVVH
ncbi:hypothetical protein MT325_m134L [Paramecium bursaria chlorella virus MT325]|uniref:Uncharacterized protein m134L n=1 Tax=Paramecium bursaria Chlorella virus MT325 TaxID=346932 RepID=A7ITL4_PBCVM|nr:hypothetical protein MT325_m134L [Paramecium bursaria chlorella virus MT325]